MVGSMEGQGTAALTGRFQLPNSGCGREGQGWRDGQRDQDLRVSGGAWRAWCLTLTIYGTTASFQGVLGQVAYPLQASIAYL